MKDATKKHDAHRIIFLHVGFILMFPLYLSKTYGEANFLKVALATTLLLISMTLLCLLSRKFEIIARDWVNAAIFTIAGIMASVLIFGLPVAWVLQRFRA